MNNNNQLTMEQLQYVHNGVTLSNIDFQVYHVGKELARGPGTSCNLRYSERDPNIKKIVLKYVDFRNDSETQNVQEQANYAIPLINREKYTQKIIDYKISKSSYSAIYEYIEGEDLHDYAERRKSEGNPLTYQEVSAIVLEVWQILEPLHARNVSHRNIKAANIIRRKSDGKLILGDFSYGQMLLGKMHFGVKFTDKMALYNVCIEPDSTDSSQPRLQDGYSLIMLFCTLLGKKMSLGQFAKQFPQNYIKMEGLTPPLPNNVVESIKFLSIGDSYGNRQPFSEAIRVFSQWTNRGFDLNKKVSFDIIPEIEKNGKLEITPTTVSMIHPCSEIADAEFFTYMQCLNNKKKQPYEKINLHFGGNLISSASLHSLNEAFQDLNTSRLRSLTINMNYNKMGSIYNLGKQFEKLQFPCLEKLTLGFNSCQILNENMELIFDSIKQKELPNLKKLFLDFRGNCEESERITQLKEELKQQQKQKINSRDPKKRERFIIKTSKNVVS